MLEIRLDLFKILNLTDHCKSWCGLNSVFTYFLVLPCNQVGFLTRIKMFTGKMKENKERSDLIQTIDRSRDSLRLSKKHDLSELPIFDFGTILAATNDFSPTNKLGQGGFGSVYKVITFFLQENLLQ